MRSSRYAGSGACLGVVLCAGLLLSSCRGEESVVLKPAFPNYAAVLALPDAARAGDAASRASLAGPETPEPPFSWNQTVIVREGASNLRVIGAYDPGFQPAEIELLNQTPGNLSITGFDTAANLLQTSIEKSTGGLTSVIPFRVHARGQTGAGICNLTYDIRKSTDRIRGTPILTRSPGDVIKPGQTVRYTWTRTTTREKRPKAEAELAGRAGAANGLYNSTLTEILAVRVQPFVTGYYLMTVTPRDVRGEPARGSTSNGQVFRCAFGSDNLAPVTDGMSADTFLPAAGQSITLAPVAVDPETGLSVFTNQVYDFGDGVVATGVSGSATHAYAAPGIYRVRCTVSDAQGLSATAEENVIVGASNAEKFAFKFKKSITPEESGIGDPGIDTLTASFSGASAGKGDRIVFVYNRNRFGRISTSDSGDDEDIVLGAGGAFSGKTRLARNVSVTGSAHGVSLTISQAQFDRTGDPRLGRSDFKGIFKNQRIAVCVIPADGSAPRVYAYTGNVEIKVKGGTANHLAYVGEEAVSGSATAKEPDPRKQEVY